MTKTRDLANLIADSKVGPSEIDTAGNYTMNNLTSTGRIVGVDLDLYANTDGNNSLRFYDDDDLLTGGIYPWSGRLNISSYNSQDIALSPAANVNITSGDLQMGGTTIISSTQNLYLSGQIDQTKNNNGSYINQFENENTGASAYVETQWINSNSQLRVGTSRNYADPWQGAWLYADTQDLLIKAGGSSKAIKFYAGNVDDIRARITSTALHIGSNTDTYFDEVAAGAVGVRLTTSGEIDAARSGAAPLNVNRLDSAGTIANFKYNGDTVADINQSGTMSLDGSLHVGNNVTVAGDFNTDIVVKLSNYNTPAFAIQRYNNAALDLFAFGEMDGGTGTPWGGSSWGAAVIHTHNRNMVFSTASSDFTDLVDGDAAMFIGYNDKVGIGMTTPSSVLEITADTNHATTEGAVVINNEMGNGYEALKLRSTGGLDANMSFRAEGTTSYWWGIGIDHSDGGSFKMGTDNLLSVNNRFKLTTGGNLSISGNMLADYYFLGVNNAWKIRPNNGNSEFCLEYDAATSSLSDANIKFKVKSSGAVEADGNVKQRYVIGGFVPNGGSLTTAKKAQIHALWASSSDRTGWGKISTHGNGNHYGALYGSNSYIYWDLYVEDCTYLNTTIRWHNNADSSTRTVNLDWTEDGGSVWNTNQTTFGSSGGTNQSFTIQPNGTGGRYIRVRAKMNSSNYQLVGILGIEFTADATHFQFCNALG